MKKTFSGMWRSGVAFFLALCMVLSCVPFSAFAREVSDVNDDGVINYVSLGASNVNGYGMHGYLSEEIYEYPLLKETANIYGYKQDTPGSYPVLIKEYLEGKGHTVNLSQMAISSMRAEEVRFLLDDSYTGDAYTDWRFCDVPGYENRWSQNWFYLAGKLEWEAQGNAGTPSQEQAVAALKEAYRQAIKDADLITVDIGVNNFGVYASNQIVSKMYENDMNTIDPELAAKYAEGKAYVMSLLEQNAGDLLQTMPMESLDHMADTMAYALVGFCLSFDAVMAQIKELNPDANITVVSIQNLMHGLKAKLPGVEGEIPFGELFAMIINAANVYTATVSPYCDMYSYADVRKNGRVEFFSEELLRYNGDPSTLSQDMKDCFDVYDNDLYIKSRVQQLLAKQLYAAGLLDISAAVAMGGDIANNLEHFAVAYMNGLLRIPALGNITLEQFFAAGAAGQLPDVAKPYYDGYMVALYTAYDVMAEIFKAGLELDTLDASTFGQSFGPVEDALLGAFFGTLEDAVMKSIADPTFQFDLNDYYPDGIYKMLAEMAGLSEGFVNTVAVMGIRTGIGNSFFGHPNGNGQEELKDAIIQSLDEDITGKDVVTKEMLAIINKLTADVWQQWVDAGYVGDVEATINTLKTMVADRYAYYTQTALPALRDELKELVETKDALNAELAILKVQLAQKKAELEDVIAKQEIGSVTAPDFDIDVEKGEHVGTPDHDCTVGNDSVKTELEAAIADLEHAIAVLEALISDINTDIDTMIALGAELAETIESLGKTLGDLAVAGQDLLEAFAAVKDVMTNESAGATAEQIKSTFDIACATVMAAGDVLKLATENASMLIGDIDTLVSILLTDSEALYNKIANDVPKAIENAPTEVKIALAAIMMVAEEKGLTVENAKLRIQAELAKIDAEFAPEIAAAEAALKALEAQMNAEISARYEIVKAQLTAEANEKIAALMAKKAALEAELKGHIETLKKLPADAAQTVRDQIQAQIDRVTGDLAIVDADIAHVAEHLEASLRIAYNEIVEKIKALYAEAIAELENEVAELKAQLEAATGKTLEELMAMGKDGLRELLKALKAELAAKGEEAIAILTDKLVELFNKMMHYATHGEVLAGLNLKYVALGDGTNDYAAALAQLVAEKAPFGFVFVNAAMPGNTVADVAANLPADVAGANLITLGFSQTEILGRALAAYLAGEDADWSDLVGEEAIPYVAEAISYVNAEIDKLELDEVTATMLKAIAEAYAFGAVEYAVNLPILIKNIREVNPTAEIVILGMYNPLRNLSFSVPGILEADLSEYAEIFDYLIDGVYAYGVGLSLIAQDVTYVDAREVEAEKSDLGLKELDALLKGDISTLYPSAESDNYIASQIMNALTIKMMGDANGDGKVDSYDAALIARYDIGLIGAENLNLAVCDINGDGIVDSYDATLVARYDVGLLAA